MLRSDGPRKVELTLSQQLAAGWERYFLWETLIAIGFAAVPLIAVAAVRKRPAIWKMLVAGVAVVCAVNVGGVLLTASGTPKVLRSVKTLDDLVGVDPTTEPAPVGKPQPGVQAVVIGATNLIFTIVAMAVIDKLGRKTLLLIGSVGTAICLGGVAGIFFTGRHESLLVWMLVGFIASFGFSQGAVIWVYISEVFPNQVRAKGQSLGTFTHWFMNAGISLTFPLLAASSGGYPFVFFSAMMVLQFFVVLFMYPETKGFTLEEMQRRLGIA